MKQKNFFFKIFLPLFVDFSILPKCKQCKLTEISAVCLHFGKIEKSTNKGKKILKKNFLT